MDNVNLPPNNINSDLVSKFTNTKMLVTIRNNIHISTFYYLSLFKVKYILKNINMHVFESFSILLIINLTLNIFN